VAVCVVADALWGAGRAWWCRLSLCAGLGVVVDAGAAACVAAAGAVAAGVVAATLLRDVVDEDAPQALTSNVNRTAASGMRRYLMCSPWSSSRTLGESGCFPDLNMR
jgi:hypothetical protein